MEEVQHCRIRNDGISLVPQLSMSTKKVCPLIGGRAHICSTTNILIKKSPENLRNILGAQKIGEPTTPKWGSYSLYKALNTFRSWVNLEHQ